MATRDENVGCIMVDATINITKFSQIDSRFLTANSRIYFLQPLASLCKGGLITKRQLG